MLSGALHASAELAPTLGVPSEEACETTYQRLLQLGFGAAGLSCLHYRVPDVVIDRFRRLHGRDNRSARDVQPA
jgi:hypothetical protein